MGGKKANDRVTINGVELRLRDIEILRLIAVEKLKNKEIEQRLGYSESTVKKLLSNDDSSKSIYRKLGVENRAGAIEWYLNAQYEIERREREAEHKAHLEQQLHEKQEELYERMSDERWGYYKSASNLPFAWSKGLRTKLGHEYKCVFGSGLTDSDLTTLLILFKNQQLNEQMLEKHGLGGKVKITNQLLSELSKIRQQAESPTLYYNIIAHGFTRTEYRTLCFLAQRPNGLRQGILAHFGLLSKVDILPGEGLPTVIRKRKIRQNGDLN